MATTEIEWPEDQGVTVADHPAPYTRGIIPGAVERGWITPGQWIDPFAGSGGAFAIEEAVPGTTVTGVEVEPAFCARWPRLTPGDATRLPFPNGTFDGAVTSPPYAGVRFADYNNGKAPSSWKGRRGYDISAKVLTRDPAYTLAENNAARYVRAGGTGEGYWRVCSAAWAELARVLRPGALFVFNYKNRPGDDNACGRHLQILAEAGFAYIDHFIVATRGYGFGANGDKRDPVGERVVLLRRAA